MLTRQGLAGYLILPLTLMSIAALLSYCGQGHYLINHLLGNAGDTLFGLLPLLLAIQLARGLQRVPLPLQPINAALAYLIQSATLHLLSPDLRHVDIGCALIAGISSAMLAPRLSRLRLPPALHSFNGPAIVLILNSFIALLLVIPLALIYNWLCPQLQQLASHWMNNAEQGFAFGMLYHALTPIGLNETLHPLLHPRHGTLSLIQQSMLSAHHAILLFGLPGMALAMLHHVPRPLQRPSRMLFLLLTLSCWLTGYTAPLVLSLLLLSLPLFILHVILSGLVTAVCIELKLQAAIPQTGAGLELLWTQIWQNDALQFSVLGCSTLLLYGLCSQCLLNLNPLRGHTWSASEIQPPERNHHKPSDLSLLAVGYLKALGGLGNLVSLQASLTYLTVEVDNPVLIDSAALQKLGVITRFELDDRKLQLLIGPIAVQLDEKIQGLAARQSLDLQPRDIQIAPYPLR